MSLVDGDPGATTSYPALRQSGLAVACSTDRAHTLAATILPAADQMNEVAQAIPTPPATSVTSGITLGAEHVAKGFRVDVFDETTATWYPLCARSAPSAYPATAKQPSPITGYVLGGGEATVPVPDGDEGAVTTVATSDLSITPAAGTGGGKPDLFVQETLFRWNGWSLVGSRPGDTLVDDPSGTTFVVGV